MVRHIVLLKFKKKMTSHKINLIFKKLAELQLIIPIIKSFSWGKYESHEALNQGFTHCFIMEFKNQKDRDQYLAHPAHIKFAVKTIFPVLESKLKSLIVFDYET